MIKEKLGIENWLRPSVVSYASVDAWGLCTPNTVSYSAVLEKTKQAFQIVATRRHKDLLGLRRWYSKVCDLMDVLATESHLDASLGI